MTDTLVGFGMEDAGRIADVVRAVEETVRGTRQERGGFRVQDVAANKSDKGVYQYTVHMMVADNVSGWDYVRGHP